MTSENEKREFDDYYSFGEIVYFILSGSDSTIISIICKTADWGMFLWWF